MRILNTLVTALLIATISIPLFHSESSSGSSLQSWTGTVTGVADGDTFDISWDSIGDAPIDGSDNPITRIRIVGVDTNELDANECLAQHAKDRLEQLLPNGTPVRLEAQDKNSISTSGPQTRALRHVFFGPSLNTNLATQLVSEGMGLPASFSDEPDYKQQYYEAGEQAKTAEVGLWQEGVCGGNPASWPELSLYVNYDAEGDDTENLNGEYIEFQNMGSSQLDISNWTLRGSARLNGATRTLPANRHVEPNGIHRVYSGAGTNTSTKTYLGQSDPWLNNIIDVLYIRDLDLNMRAAAFWPCTVTCIPQKTLAVEDVRYDADGSDASNPNGEWIRLRNVGDTTINLNNWRIKESGKFYKFDSNDSIAPGKRFVIYVGKGTDSSSVKYWGNSSGILNNSGNDYVRILNPDSVEIDCYTWGIINRCPNENIRGAIRIYANYNASGDDRDNPNGEWIAFHNTSASTVNLSGYKIYTPGHTYTFPSGTKISANGRFRLHIGSGTDTKYNYYWGKSRGILRNSGDYVQLRNTRNTVHEQHKWSCSISCGYSFGLDIDKVNYNAPGDDRKNPNGEWIRIKNNSSATQSLRNWKLRVGPYQIVSVADRVMEPGESITIYIGKGKNTSKKMYWGKSKGILYNTGSRTVELMSPLRHEVDCYSWGSGSCK